MRTKLHTILALLFVAVVCAHARTVVLTVKRLVRGADAIVVATATTEPEHGEIMFARNDTGHLWWELPDASPTEVTNALAKLVATRDEFTASTNLYASRLLYIPLWHHQHVWETEFRVSTVLKGDASSNIAVRLGLPYATDKTKLRKGESYILFLNQQYADVNTPGEFTLMHSQRALPVAKEYEWNDTDLEFRKFTHGQFLSRIRELVREEQEEDNRPATD